MFFIENVDLYSLYLFCLYLIYLDKGISNRIKLIKTMDIIVKKGKNINYKTKSYEKENITCYKCFFCTYYV